MCFNQTGDISTLNGSSLKLVDKFTYQGSSVSSTDTPIDTRLTEAWTTINRLLVIWKSDLTNLMKRSFFQVVIVSIMLYGCTTWTLTKQLEKKLYTNAVTNVEWVPEATPLRAGSSCTDTYHASRKLSELDELDMQETTREVGTSSSLMYSYGPLHMAEQKQDDQLEPTNSRSVRIRSVTLRTSQKR